MSSVETKSRGPGPRDASWIPLVVIAGPTAVGKTAISIELAEGLGGEIVSADSRLIYRGMDIGTAKPTPAERARVPHHLVDIADPDQTWSLSLFQRAAAHAIADIHGRGMLPMLVGGSGQYIHAVTHGWKPPEIPPDEGLRQELEARAAAEGNQSLYNELQASDPEAAGRIDPRNLRRIVRALEVIRLTGRKFSGQRGQAEGPYRLLTVGLARPRQELYTRIDARIESMFENGLLEEVRSLLAKGYSPALPSMSSIGYRECAEALRGEATPEEAVSRMRRGTRRFVRRQANWFKPADPLIHWFQANEDPREAIKATIQEFLRE
ncbi:MAG: tRNA (adenosine(37)-N6)-dimethylallyltransferase MiaA [Chloroflexi bacterium]|nr:tRNA (adenosine(37)-N6)-dimethylallyltransferase MiaA [Chloroflexota bacterium]